MYAPAPKIEYDNRRLAVLRSLELLDSKAEPEFDNLIELVAHAFDCKIALISLVDDNRQWFKADFGLGAAETPRAPSFCGHAIAQDGAFIIHDALQDARFAENPLVTGPPQIRFYAGAPLVFRQMPIGTLCVIDDRPHASFDGADARRLLQYGRLAEELIDARTRRLHV